MEVELKGLVIALHPKLCFRSGVPEPLFLVYEDDVVCSVIVDKFVGAFVGEFVVEDVEIGSQEFRRRLRFRRMPNLIQSQARLVASFDEVILSVARQYFGLNDGKSVRVIVGDALEMIEKIACGLCIDGLDAKFDVVMVDLDSSEARSGISAPPAEFLRKSVFQVMRNFLGLHSGIVNIYSSTLHS
nr:methyltransferase-like protein 13 [Tanacetum cinerariifolium]